MFELLLLILGLIALSVGGAIKSILQQKENMAQTIEQDRRTILQQELRQGNTKKSNVIVILIGILIALLFILFFL